MKISTLIESDIKLQTTEERALNDTSSLHANSNVYSLIYVNVDADHNFSNINDIIPSSLKVC